MTAEVTTHLVRRGRYPHVVERASGVSVRQTQRLDEVTCGICLGEAGDFIKRMEALDGHR
jgi:hypothetical protein